MSTLSLFQAPTLSRFPNFQHLHLPPLHCRLLCCINAAVEQLLESVHGISYQLLRYFLSRSPRSRYLFPIVFVLVFLIKKSQIKILVSNCICISHQGFADRDIHFHRPGVLGEGLPPARLHHHRLHHPHLRWLLQHGALSQVYFIYSKDIWKSVWQLEWWFKTQLVCEIVVKIDLKANLMYSTFKS